MNARPNCYGCKKEQAGWILWGAEFICSECFLKAQAKKSAEMKRYLE